jgi:hypothetical protein
VPQTEQVLTEAFLGVQVHWGPPVCSPTGSAAATFNVFICVCSTSLLKRFPHPPTSNRPAVCPPSQSKADLLPMMVESVCSLISSFNNTTIFTPMIVALPYHHITDQNI